MKNKPAGIFITGTDTGVGKTLVAAALIKVLQKQGLNPGYFKPMASGALKTRQGPTAPDVNFVLKATSLNDSPTLVNPVCLVPPLAPLTAAELTGVKWTLSSILKSYRSLQKDHPFMIVEGVGGILVPLKKQFLVTDLMVKMGLPVMVVARPSLGTINHTLMTLTLLKQRGLNVAGFLFNGQKGKAGLAERTAPQVISKFSGAPFWGNLPFDPKVSERAYSLGSIPGRLEKMVPRSFFKIFMPCGAPRSMKKDSSERR
jgi:dethiobiotin synthetase